MTALFFGLGTGIERNLGYYLGARAQLGDPTLGRAGQKVEVNAANGNLVIQSADEILAGRGPDAAFSRTYNSQGAIAGETDNWWFNVQRKLEVTAKTPNASGGKLALTDWDGSTVEFSYVAGQGRYQLAATSPYSDDYITFDAVSNQFTWVDGTSGARQKFQYFATPKTARLISVADPDGNTVTYDYDSAAVTGKLSKITTTIGATGVAGQGQGTTNVVNVAYWAGTTNVKSFTTTYLDAGGATRSINRTAYDYDATNRLIRATVDLTPENGADTQTYVTEYTYKAASGVDAKRVATIVEKALNQTTGAIVTVSSLAITYDAAGRVTQLSEAIDGVTARATGFTYNAAGQVATTTDALGQTTAMTYDAQGRVTRIEEPAAASGGNARITRIDYDTLLAAANAATGMPAIAASSDIRLYDGAANETAGLYLTREWRQLDAAYNLAEQGSVAARDPATGAIQATIVRNAYVDNLLVRSASYVSLDSDGPGAGEPADAQTTRYVYDGERHLRFVVSGAGRVSEYVYDAPGQLVSTIAYADSLYPVAGLAATATLSEAQLTAWTGTIADKSGVQRTDTNYDFRGAVDTVTSYGRALANGNGDANGPKSATQYVYDQYGNLLKRQVVGAAQAELFIYDGLGRTISTTTLAGATSTITIDDGARITTVATPGLASQVSAFDMAGELLSSTADGATTSFAYDRLGRPRYTTDATGVRRYSLYDGRSREVADVDADGSVIEYRYDAANRLVATIARANLLDAATVASYANLNANPGNAFAGPAASADDRWAWSVYDKAGRLVQTIDAAGAVTAYAYDASNRLVRTTAYDTRADVAALKAALPTAPVTVTASAADRVSRNFYDADGLMIATLDAEGAITEIAYDGAGRRIRTLSHAALTDSAQRATGTLAALLASAPKDSSAASKDIADYWLYDGRGLVLATVDGEGQVSRYGYSARGDVTSEEHGAKLTAAQVLALLGQAAPTDATIAAAINGATGPLIETTTYARRSDGQPSSAVRQLAGGKTETTSYAYDALGRLVAKTVSDTLSGESRGATSRYDARGRLIGSLGGEGTAALAALGAGASAAQVDALYQTWGTRYFYDNADRLIATSQPDGSDASALLRTLFYYDTDGNLRFAINAAGEVTEHRWSTFDQEVQTVVYGGRLTAGELAGLSGGLVDSAVTAAIARLTGDTAGLNSVATTAYDQRGLALSVTDAGGYTASFQYSTFAQLLRSDAPSDAGGAADTTLYTYDRRGLKASEQRLLGGSSLGAMLSTFGYDAFGRLQTATTAADGRHFTYAYDRDSRITATTDRMGAVESFQYDARGNQFLHVDRSGRSTQFDYDLFNRTVTTTTQEGVVTRVIRNAQGQTISIEDGAHRVTSYSYDRNGQLRFASDAAGTSETRYDRAQRVFDTIDARGVRTHFTYDAVGRTLTRTDNADGALGAPPVTTTWEYDAKGQQVSVTDALNTVTRVSYDLRGNKVKVIADAGGLAIETRYAIGATGKVTSMVEAWGTPLARTTSYAYDSMGRLLQTVEDPGGLNLASSFTWDDSGNMVASTDPLGRVTRFVHDAENRQVMSVNAEGEVVETGYDGEGRAVWTQAYATRIARATLDAQPLALTAAQVHALAPASADDRLALSAYDRDGRLAYAVDAEGFVTGNAYDAANNLTATTRYGAKIAAAKGESAASIAARLAAVPSADTATTSYAYDGANRLWRITDANQVVTRYVLDALGQIVETHVADGTADEAITTRQFDALGRVLQETRAAGETYAATVHYAYDALGRATDITDARGAVTHRDYDRLGRLTRERRPLDAGHSAVTEYAYDARGNVTAVKDARGNWSWNYYDQADRLVLQIDQEGYATATTYLASGAVDSVTRYANRVSNAGNPAVRPTLNPDSNKDATSHFVRDRLDRVTATLDALGQSESYTLDAFGERTAVTNKLGGVTHYAYDHRGLVLSEAVDASSDGSSPAFVKAIYDYDARGNLKTQTEAPGLGGGRVTRFEYDKLDRLVRKVLPAVDGQAALPEENYAYDARGNLIHASDAIGAQVYSSYDDLGRKIAEISATGTYTTWDYDLNGNVTGQKVFGTRWNGAPPSPADGYRETRFDYDAANRQISARVLNVQTGRLSGGSYVLGGGAQGIATAKEYDAAGNLVRETDGNGGQTVHYYDKLGRELAKVDPAGYVTNWSRDTNGNVLTEVRHANAVALPVDPAGAIPVAVASADDRETRFEYDANGRRTKLLRMALNNVMDGASGALSQGVTSEVDYAYNGFDEVLSKTEAHAAGTAGDVTDYAYDKFGRLVRQSDAAIIDWRGAAVRKVTSYTYDALNNVVQTVESASDGSESRTTSYDYVNGRLSHVHDAGNFDRFYAYDLNGRLIRESWTRRDSLWDAAAPAGHEFEEANITQYDAAGRAVRSFKAVKQGADWVQPQTGTATVMAYNTYGEMISRAVAAAGDATGQVQEELTYDNAGRVIGTNGGDGSWKLIGYDANGNATITITAQTGSLKGQNVYTVVAQLGDVANLSDAGHIITLSRYDARNLATASIEPNRAVATNLNDVVSASAWKVERFRSYNAFGEVASEIDARGNITGYGYNAMGRLVAKVGPAVDVTDEHGGTQHVTTLERYFYDAAGRLTGVQDANGNVTRRVLLAGSGHGDAEPLVATEYRADGSIWETGYDVFGQKRSDTQGYFAGDTARLTTQYGYDGLGRLTQVTRPSGVSEYFGFDVLGQRIRRWNSVQTVPVYDYENPDYISDPWNQNEYIVGYPIIGYTSLVERTDYDIEGRVTAVTTIGGDTTQTTYAWDAGRSNTGIGVSGGWVKTISYGTGLSEVEVSDSFGHMLSRKNQGNYWFTMTYNSAGQLSDQHGDSNGSDVAYSYDLSGRVTGLTQIAQSMGFSGWGGLYNYYGVRSQIAQKAAYLYDADGNRLSESTWNETQSYYFDWATPANGFVASGNPVLQTLQKATAQFDAANRMTRFHDTGEGQMGRVSIDNLYDANGNVRRTRTEYQSFDAAGNLSAATSVEDDWYRYDALNRFVVVKGSLVGLAGTSAAYIDIGSLGRGIEYNAAGQRAAMITQTVEAPLGYDPNTYGNLGGGYIGAGYTAYQNSLSGVQSYSYIGSSFDTGQTTFLAASMLIDQQIVDGGGDGGGGGTVSFPYYDTALQGTWYLAADGVTSYLALGDGGGAAGSHGGLAVPGALNTYDTATSGTWSFVANGTDGWGSPTGYYTVSFSTQSSSGTGGGTSSGGTGYPYFDPAYNGTWYLAANGTTSYIVLGDTAGSAGTYGGLTPTNIGGGIDPVTGSQWYIDVTDYTSGIVSVLVYDPGTGTGTGTGGGGGTVTYPYYDSAKGGMFYQASGSGTVFFVPGDTATDQADWSSLQPPASFPSAWTIDLTALGGGYVTVGTWYMDPAGYPRFEPTNGSGGGGTTQTYPYYDVNAGGTFYKVGGTGAVYLVVGDTATDGLDYSYLTPPATLPGLEGYYDAYVGFIGTGTWYDSGQGYAKLVLGDMSGGVVTPTYPYYDTNAGGTFYQSTNGAAYLVAGDTGGAAGTHGGLALPASYPSYDAAAGGTWTMGTSGYAVLTLGVPVTYPYFDSAKGGTFYQSLSTAEVYFVLGDTATDNVDWGWITPPGSYPQTFTIDLTAYNGSIITLGTWYADPAGYPRFEPVGTGGTGGGTTYPYYDAASGGTWYQNGTITYLVQGDASGGTAAWQGLTPPATVPQYASVAGGTWYANGTRYTFVPGDKTGGYTPTYDAAQGGMWYKAADSQELYLWQGEAQANPAHEGLSLPTSYPVHDAALGGTWSQVVNYDPYNLTTTVVFTPDPSYPYYDAQVGGTRYLAADGSGYLVLGDYSGSLGSYAGLAAPAARPSFDALGRGVWLDNAPLGLRLVLGATSYFDAAAGWTVFRQPSGALYRISGDVTASPYYASFTPPATLPAWDAAAYGTWYADSTGAGLGPILMVGDVTMAPMTVNRTRESYEYNADGYLVAVRSSQQVLSR
ncbi:MAG: hypothetical protein KGN34_10070, partial [Sphingomonadales bacterium]|nr:hypothetical protein [Sphingomonadales bacterium]